MHVFQLYCNINNLVIPVIRNYHLGNMLTKGPKYKTFTTPVYWFKEQVETPTEELAIFYIHWMFYSSYLCTLSRLQKKPNYLTKYIGHFICSTPVCFSSIFTS
jgi:hypothetical protein